MFNNKQWDRSSAMEMSKRWGGSHSMRSTDLMSDDTQSFSELERSMRTDEPPSRRILDEIEQSWLLEPQESKQNQSMLIDLGCIECPRRWFWWIVSGFWSCVVIIGLSILAWKLAPEGHQDVAAPDGYSLALRKALTFFDIQKCKPAWPWTL